MDSDHTDHLGLERGEGRPSGMDLWRERRLRGQRDRRRKRAAILRWIGAVLMVGAGTASALSLARLVAPNAEARMTTLWGASLLGALGGGLFGFVVCCMRGYRELMKEREPLAPRVAAWWIGIPAAVIGAALATLEAMHNGPNRWAHIAIACLGGLGGFATWWCFSKIVFARDTDATRDEGA